MHSLPFLLVSLSCISITFLNMIYLNQYLQLAPYSYQTFPLQTAHGFIHKFQHSHWSILMIASYYPNEWSNGKYTWFCDDVCQVSIAKLLKYCRHKHWNCMEKTQSTLLNSSVSPYYLACVCVACLIKYTLDICEDQGNVHSIVTFWAQCTLLVTQLGFHL